MATYSGRTAVLAFGRQPTEDTPLVTPKFEVPMGGGSAAPSKNINDLDWIFDSQDIIGQYTSLIEGTLSAQIPCLPKSLPSLLHLILGALTTTGAADPFSHAATPADGLPWSTWFFRQPGDNYWTVSDLKLSSVEIPFAAGSPLVASITGTGKGGPAGAERAAAKWGAASVVEQPQPFFTYIGADVLMDFAATPAATQVHNVPSGTIRLTKDLERIQTDGLGHQFIAERGRRFEFALDNVVVENNDAINAHITGSTSGTSPSPLIAYGSIKQTFGLDDGTAKTARKLELVANKVQFAIGGLPEGQADGSVARVSMVGTVMKPASGATITATVLNAEDGSNY